MSRCDYLFQHEADDPHGPLSRCPAVAVMRLASGSNPELLPADVCDTHGWAVTKSWVRLGHAPEMTALEPDDAEITEADWRERIARLKRGNGRLAG